MSQQSFNFAEDKLRQLKIYASTQIDTLASIWIEDISAAPLPPLDRETVVVASQAMARWLNLRWCEQSGIAAASRMDFPARLCHRLAVDLAATSGGSELSEGAARFEHERLRWFVYDLLDEQSLAGSDKLEAPLTYLRNDPAETKRYELAAKIARTFDTYQFYRPDLLADWEAGELRYKNDAHEIWQSELWRRLLERTGPWHFGNILKEALGAIADVRLPTDFPKRLGVFCVPSLPPLFVELLGAIASVIPVSFYVFTPTHEYWSDIESPKEQARRRRFDDSAFLTERPSGGTQLLASLGMTGRDYFAALQNVDVDGNAWVQVEETLTKTRIEQPRSALERLQAGVRGEAPENKPPRSGTSSTTDRSLRVHAAVSIKQEVETLRDEIFDAIATTQELRPHDIVVMVANLAAYVPTIKAVFDLPAADGTTFPYHIVGEAAVDAPPAAKALLGILTLANSRATSNEVLNLLELPPLLRAAGIEPTEFRQAEHWVERANIRWGLSAEHRENQLDLPKIEATTWQHGMDALLLGHMMGASSAIVAGAVPQGRALSSSGEALGNFTAFANKLFRLAVEARTPRHAHEWHRFLNGVVDELIHADDESVAEIAMLREAFDRLTEANAIIGTAPFGPNTLVRFLNDEFQRSGAGDAFLTGRVTICELQPGRALPFKAVFLAGLNDDAFPRRRPIEHFDLTTQRPRRGDKNANADDRYAFLESVLAAGHRLHLSYVALDESDGSQRPPSLVVNEILDAVRDDVLVRHWRPYNECSPDHFTYGRVDGLQADSGGSTPFISPLVDPSGVASAARAPSTANTEVIEIGDLVAFWKNPAKHFCRHVLDLRLLSEEKPAPEIEGLRPSNLESYGLTSDLLERHTDIESNSPHICDELQSAGAIAPGAYGQAQFDECVEAIRSITQALIEREPRPDQPIEVEGPAWVLRGVLDNLYGNEQIATRPAKKNDKFLIGPWIKHLAAVAADIGVATTCAIAVDGSYQFGATGPDADPTVHLLSDLVGGYLLGRTRPLAFFPNATFEYARRKDSDEKARLARAKEKFVGNDRFRGDYADTHIRYVFREASPLDAHAIEFRHWATTIAAPLIAATVKK